jgi:tetratricopeptide (TPR) repeat protein
MLAILAALVFALSSCKSVETLSAQNQTDKGNYTQAADMAKRAVTKNPNDAEAHFLLGETASNTEDMATAYREFTMAGKLDPKKLSDVEAAIKANWDRHYDGGMGVLEKGDAAGAAREFNLATQADPREIKGWLNMAKVYYGMADKDSTLMLKVYAAVDTMLVKNKETDPNYQKVLSFEGRILARRGMTAEAIKIFDELLSLDPSESEVVEESGIQCLSRKDWQSASELFPLVIEAQQKTNSESFEPYYNLGAAYLNLKDYTKAIDALTEAVRIDPANKKGQYYLLLANYQGSQFDEAIHLGQNYTTKYADDQNGWRVLSLAYSKRGMTAKAQEAAKKAMELDKK